MVPRRSNSYIYVCSAITRRVYTGAATYHELHHSSFLKGEPVLAAGDWIVKNGEVLLVNGASGHYRPTLENLRTFASVCQQFWNANTMVDLQHVLQEEPNPHKTDSSSTKKRSRFVLMRNFILLGDKALGVLETDPALLALLRYMGRPIVSPDSPPVPYGTSIVRPDSPPVSYNNN